MYVIATIGQGMQVGPLRNAFDTVIGEPEH